MGRINFETCSIGADDGAFVIAEAGVNHNGDIDRAIALIDAAANAGADAVKFQTFKAKRLVNATAQKAAYQVENTGDAGSQLAMLERLELDDAAHHKLLARCSERDILFMSSPFDEQSADFLADLGITVFKVPSGELTNTPFLAHLGEKGLPIILSTGMSTMGDVETGVAALEATGNHELAILHCVSSYPTDPKDVNLRAMRTLRSFGYPVGYSDHTLGIPVPIAAVALGACCIEKHFTLDRELPGPDHRASLEPDELAAMIAGIRAVEQSLGDGRKRPTAGELDTAKAARKSLVAAVEIAAGTVVTVEMITIKRPGTGMPPSMRESVVGRTARQPIARDELLALEKFGD